MNTKPAAAGRIACVTALGALLASCGGSIEGACVGICPEPEPVEETAEIRPDFLVTHGTDFDTESDLMGLLPPEGPEETRGNVVEFDPQGIEGAMDAKAWGAWSAGGALAVVVPGEKGDVLGISWAPHFPATNPKELDGAATWSGGMVGVNIRDGGAISGRAVVVLEDFDDPAVDISFTGMRKRIRTLGADIPIPDTEWRGLPVRGGSFSSGFPGNRIEGRFHGDLHQGVGGVFERGAVVGAFGSSRD